MANIWLHLGLGSFHRAHQAYAFNQLLEQGLQDWHFAKVCSSKTCTTP